MKRELSWYGGPAPVLHDGFVCGVAVGVGGLSEASATRPAPTRAAASTGEPRVSLVKLEAPGEDRVRRNGRLRLWPNGR